MMLLLPGYCCIPIANGQVFFTDANDADSDNDGLTDGEEIRMHVVDDIMDVLKAYNYMYSYIPDALISDNGGIYFTVNSNPLMADSDSDGILDIDEVKQVGTGGIADRYSIASSTYYNYRIDEHFYDYSTAQSKLNPMRKDTLESLYPELTKDSKTNSPSNATYLNIKGNHVTIETNVYFTGAADDLACDFFSGVSASDTRTVAQVLKEGLESVWNDDNETGKKYYGNVYDFYPGMEIELTTNVNVISEPTREHVEIQSAYESGRSGHQNTTTWHTNNSRLIILRSNGRSLNEAQHVVSHEFGHAIGMKDAYDAENNKYYAPQSNTEITYIDSSTVANTFASGEIMFWNGRVLANDIEMVMYAYAEDHFQVFVPYYQGSIYDISKAIKARPLYTHRGDTDIFEWNGSTMIVA